MRVTKRMRDNAADLERLESTGILPVVTWPLFMQRFNPGEFRDYLRDIPAALRSFANAVESQSKQPGSKPRAHTLQNTALAHLVAFVLHCTGTPHDKEVSALVNAVRAKKGKNESPYTADAQKTWRREHASVVRHAFQMFPSLFRR